MLLTILLTFTLTVLAIAGGWYARLWYVRNRTADEIRTGDKLCGVCHAPLPDGAIRTHAGLWRCRDHKGHD